MSYEVKGDVIIANRWHKNSMELDYIHLGLINYSFF